MTGRNVLHATGAPRLARAAKRATLAFVGRWEPASAERGRLPRGGLRVLACTPTYVPDHRRGAETTLHLVLRALAERGHDVRVLLTEEGTATPVDGVEVLSPRTRRDARAIAQWCDLIIGQLDARNAALDLGARCRRPVVYYMHVGNVARRAFSGRPALTVFASNTVQHQYPWIEPALVVHPPVPETLYATSRGDAITLVTPTGPKGVHVFAEIARRCPERAFLAVGSPDPAVSFERNVTVLTYVDDMREVYGRTRILLMPSVYESYGRVGVEAAASGIPTIAHPVPGIREALGDAAIFADRHDVGAWVRAVRALDDPAAYAGASARARARYEALDSTAELDALETALQTVVSASVPSH